MVSEMVHQYLMRCLRLMLYLPWIFIIMVGSIIPLRPPQQAVELVVLINLQVRPSVKGLPCAALTCQDQDLLCIHLLLAAVLVQEPGVRLLPPYPGSNDRACDRVRALQAYYQQHRSTLPGIRTPIISGSRRSSSHRSHVQVGPAASSSDQVGGFYFIPSGTSGHNFQESENPLSTRFHAWERDHFPPFSLNQVDRESSWSAFHQPAAGASDPGVRSGSFRQRHGSERMQ